MICDNIAPEKVLKPICQQYIDFVQKKFLIGKDRQIR